jgi:serine/threonine protein kinase
VVITPAAPAAGPTKCPSCKAALPAGATVCLDCGWVQADLDLGKGEAGEQMIICTNPACGAANAPSERYCQRCNTMLPTAPGTLLHGRYKVEKLLAMGGFGAVYRAVDTKSGAAVAIKDMICADPEEFNIRLNFFRREAEILRSLNSLPVVPRVFDFIHQGQSAHLVMEFIKGQDLLKIMEASNNKPFAFQQVVEWGKLICDVLHHMHTLSPPVVHRDMKPDNIMLLEGAKGIKLIDFGTARDIGRTHRTRLQAKTRVYTEGYAPPEQIIGKPEARSDLFALAGTLYHLLTGKAPEGFFTAKEIETQLKGGNGAVPAEQRWFYELIRINLSEDVNDRYFTAREFKADLEARRVSTEAPCPKCRHANKVREPYCGKCAAPLTDETPPCYHCGKTNRMGSRCCIHCGNRLR